MVEKNKPDNIISLHNVRKEYLNDTVLHDVNLDIQAGECVVLVGHNGAGKTTLMKLMLGLSRPTSGTIEVLKSDPVTNSALSNKLSLGYLPESVAFYDAMTGEEILNFYASLKGISISECQSILELVGLQDAAKRRVGTYSKGMRQRLGLAQAIIGKPQLLFLDEPTTGLDPLLRQHFYELIEKLHKEGVTSVISSHALNEVEARANRFVIMKAGYVIASGTIEELYQQASLPVRMKVSVQPGQATVVAERLGSGISIGNINNQSLSLSCLKEEKMPLIRHISNLGEVVHDLQIIPPRLDEVYTHFMSGES